MSTNIPELSALVQAAHDIVINARRRDDLGSLTVRTVRKQVERDFALADGTLDEASPKTALRNAVNAALAEDLVLNNVEKRKRSPEASAEVEEVKLKKAKKTHNKKDVKGTPDDESGAGQKRKKKIAKSKETIVTDSEDSEGLVGATASTSRTELGPAVKLPKNSGSKAKPFVAEEKKKHVDQSADGVNSGSEASVLMNESPRRKRTKGKTKENTKKISRKSEKEKDPEALSSDEATIKRLKSFVSACGVRKPWSKEFADLPLPGQQIARLKQILADLGMTKRYSLEKAKAIKERRALSRELNDVVEFERKAGASRERKPRANAKRVVAELDTNSEFSESEDDDDGPESPNAKKNAASKIIQAYLANQSSDEA